MENCPHCGALVSPQDPICPSCGRKINIKKKSVYKGKSYFLIRLVSFCVPILGFIVFMQQKHSDPLGSKIALKWTLFGMLMYALVGVLFILFYFFILIGILT